MVESQTDYIIFSQRKGIAEKYLEHFFITSSSSYCFNKTDFEQYLLNRISVMAYEYTVKCKLIFKLNCGISIQM